MEATRIAVADQCQHAVGSNRCEGMRDYGSSYCRPHRLALEGLAREREIGTAAYAAELRAAWIASAPNAAQAALRRACSKGTPIVELRAEGVR